MCVTSHVCVCFQVFSINVWWWMKPIHYIQITRYTYTLDCRHSRRLVTTPDGATYHPFVVYTNIHSNKTRIENLPTHYYPPIRNITHFQRFVYRKQLGVKYICLHMCVYCVPVTVHWNFNIIYIWNRGNPLCVISLPMNIKEKI